MDALIPCVIKVAVTITSAASEPRTTATAATYFSRFRDDAAFKACRIDGRFRERWCVYVDIGQNTTMKTWKWSLFALREDISTCVDLGLTFASLHALRPAVSNMFVANTSAILKPITPRSATTDSA